MNFLKKIILVVFLTFFIFFLTDLIVTNINGYRGASKFYIKDNLVGFNNKPNFSGKFGGYLDSYSSKVSTGPLSERISFVNDCNSSKNIIFLGDSGTAGFEVNDNETFISQINAKQCKFNGINFGVRGHNTHNILGNYKRIKNMINHDAVVYIIFPNDLSDNLALPSGANNLIKKFGNVFNEVYYPPKLSNLEKIYFNLRMTIADNFYATTKIIYSIENFKRFFRKKIKTKKINSKVIKISEDEMKVMTNLIYKLSYETKNINKKLFIAGYPCLYNKKCKTLELENYLIKKSKEENLFTVIPLANNLYKKFSNESLNRSLMRFYNDPHLTKYGHMIVSKYLLNYLKNRLLS
jgi:hypothetical protein